MIYQYANLHGDIVATASPGDPTPTVGADFDEYGNPTDSQSRRYGWLGGKQRSEDSLAGLILMGVRLYSPALDRFLQSDPVSGGSANDYDYVGQDPIDQFDFSNESGHWSHSTSGY